MFCFFLFASKCPCVHENIDIKSILPPVLFSSSKRTREHHQPSILQKFSPLGLASTCHSFALINHMHPPFNNASGDPAEYVHLGLMTYTDSTHEKAKIPNFGLNGCIASGKLDLYDLHQSTLNVIFAAIRVFVNTKERKLSFV